MVIEPCRLGMVSLLRPEAFSAAAAQSRCWAACCWVKAQSAPRLFLAVRGCLALWVGMAMLVLVCVGVVYSAPLVAFLPSVSDPVLVGPSCTLGRNGELLRP